MTPAGEERGAGERPGYRLGPFILVPEFRTSARDPWAHRKGEPRMLALLWAMYLMGGALMTIFAVRSLGAPSSDRYAYGCRAMLFIVILGTSVLWPMARLSQAPPKRPLYATLVDLFAMLAPVQAVIWPMTLLTSWGWDVVAGLNLLVASWAALASALVLRGAVSRSWVTRTLLMAVLVLLVGAAPGLGLLLANSGAPALPRWWSMLSPITGVLELTSSPANRRVTMEGWEWAWSAAPMVVGLALLPLAARLGRSGGGRGAPRPIGGAGRWPDSSQR